MIENDKKEQTIRIQDIIIKNYKKEIDLLYEQNILLKGKNALLSEMVERQKQIIESYERNSRKFHVLL